MLSYFLFININFILLALLLLLLLLVVFLYLCSYFILLFCCGCIIISLTKERAEALFGVFERVRTVGCVIKETETFTFSLQQPLMVVYIFIS